MVNDKLIETCIINPPSQDIDKIDLASTRRIISGVSRQLTKDAFSRNLRNGELKKREWLLYSESRQSLYCYPCCLMSSSPSPFSKGGFNNWKKVHEKLSEHEKSALQVKAQHDFLVSSGKVFDGTGTVNRNKSIQVQIDIKYRNWRAVFQRIVAAIKFLATRGLAFRGSDEVLGSESNGNFLGTLELISQFDPFFAEHLTNVSYISCTTCKEFIKLMSDILNEKIVAELKLSKYFSIILDSTPDIAKVDQLTMVIRYVLPGGAPVERFLKFLPSVGHMEQAFLSELEVQEIDISDCRGQSYDNASNISGAYSGLQVRIKAKENLAEYVPCSAHSLNLIGSSAVECTAFGVAFFFFLQQRFNFFFQFNLSMENLDRSSVTKRQRFNRQESFAYSMVSSR